jgi:hypothetical protein
MNKEDRTMNMGAMQDMMKDMMKNMGGMPDMCAKMMQQMAGAFSGSSNTAPFATPEIGGLFEEWSRTVEEEILAFIKEKGKTSLPEKPNSAQHFSSSSSFMPSTSETKILNAATTRFASLTKAETASAGVQLHHASPWSKLP